MATLTIQVEDNSVMAGLKKVLEAMIKALAMLCGMGPPGER